MNRVSAKRVEVGEEVEGPHVDGVVGGSWSGVCTRESDVGLVARGVVGFNCSGGP